MRHNQHSNKFIICQQAKLFITHEHTSKLLALDHPRSVLEDLSNQLGCLQLLPVANFNTITSQSASHRYPKTGMFCEDPKFRVHLWYDFTCITNRYIYDGPKFVLATGNFVSITTTFPLISSKSHFCYRPEISGLLHPACFRYVKQPFPSRTRNFGSSQRSFILTPENSHFCFGPEISGLSQLASLCYLKTAISPSDLKFRV